MSPKSKQHYLTLVSGKNKNKLLFKTETEAVKNVSKLFFQILIE